MKEFIISEAQTEKAVLVGLITPEQNEQKVKEYLDELAFLADTAGVEAVKRFYQKLDYPNSVTFVGSGKLQEIKEYVVENEIGLVIFDDELSAKQLRNIEKELQVKILDRTNLILDIFARRAQTAHAKTQVELAQYKYMLPRLTRLWTHLERQRGGVGMRGPGETQLETDKRIILDKISKLKRDLVEIDKQKSVQRKNRGKMVRVALVGYTNVGKSTLMKVLTGIYQKDSGSITYKGKETEFHNTREAQDAGVVIVHQELNMVGDLTVAQNIFIGREPKKGFSIDDKKMIEDSKKLFQELNIEINPKEKMNNLTVGKQQMCEIAKAISHKAEVIIFDEPSAALTEKEIADLFEIIRDLRKKGLGIVYISHRMDEIKTITDRVTVMRDGGYVGTLITADSTKEDIINMMVGRVIYEDPKEHSMVAPDAPVVLKVENLNAGKMVQNVSFELRKGEILGFSGLMGAGRTETARALFGADPKQSGKISIRGKDGQLREVTINSPQDAVKYGIGYLSEDRRRYGCVVQKSVTENTTLATMEEFTSGIFINKSKEKEVSEKYVKELATKTPNCEQLVVNLSGGNQQKVVIAKWLTRDSEILIFDEPTRGIDVGAKNEIYKLMNRLAAEGKSIIMISSEMTEVLRMSDRIIVMCEGKITGNIDISEATQEHIMNHATRNIN